MATICCEWVEDAISGAKLVYMTALEVLVVEDAPEYQQIVVEVLRTCDPADLRRYPTPTASSFRILSDLRFAVARRFEEAVQFARRSLDLQPGQPGAWRVIAAASGYRGRIVEARAACEKMMELAPDLSEAHLRTFMPDPMVDRYVEGLRRAGWSSEAG